MSLIAFVSDSLAVRRILDHLGLSPPQQEKLPPAREVLLSHLGQGVACPHVSSLAHR
jgi:hypothetical protein